MLWINIISVAAIVAQTEYGYIVSPNLQVIALGIVNFVVRLITKEELE